MTEEKLFTKEAVVTAIKLTAQGMAGLLKRDEAYKAIESLPESLAGIVMEESIAASKMRAIEKAKTMSKLFGMLAQGLSDNEKEE